MWGNMEIIFFIIFVVIIVVGVTMKKKGKQSIGKHPARRGSRGQDNDNEGFGSDNDGGDSDGGD